MKSRKVAYAVLSNGAILGFGGKNVAIPFQALTTKPGEKALLLDIDKQELAQAPGFNDKQWPDLNAAATGKTVGLAVLVPTLTRTQQPLAAVRARAKSEAKAAPEVPPPTATRQLRRATSVPRQRPTPTTLPARNRARRSL